MKKVLKKLLIITKKIMPELKTFEFNLKTKTKFGVGEALKLGEFLKDFKFKKIANK